MPRKNVLNPVKPRYRKKGFTLVETLLAIAILVFMITSVIAVARQSMDAWRRMAAGLEKQAEITGCYDQLIKDLEAAFFKDDNQKWFACGPLKKGSIDAKNNCWLRFFVNTSEGVQAVSYHIRALDPANATNTDVAIYALYRHVSDSKFTMDFLLSQLENVEPDAFFNSQYSDKNTFISASFLAANIVRFEILLFYRTAQGILKSIDTTLSEAFFPLEIIGQGKAVLPEEAQITITIIDSYGAQKLLNYNGSDNETFLSEVIKSHGAIYSQKIFLAF